MLLIVNQGWKKPFIGFNFPIPASGVWKGNYNAAELHMLRLVLATQVVIIEGDLIVDNLVSAPFLGQNVDYFSSLRKVMPSSYFPCSHPLNAYG